VAAKSGQFMGETEKGQFLNCTNISQPNRDGAVPAPLYRVVGQNGEANSPRCPTIRSSPSQSSCSTVANEERS